MNTHQDKNATLPVKHSLAWLYSLSFLIAALVTVVSIAGIKYHASIYPNEELVRALVPNDAVNLLIGLPILLGSLWLTWRGRLIGLLLWPGALFFASYSYLPYLFTVPLNWAFLFHLTIVTLSVYTLIGLFACIDGQAVQQKLAGAVPERLAGGVLAGLGLLFSLRVIGMSINAFAGGGPLTQAEFATNVADFLTMPAWIAGGILLWRRREFGYAAGLGLLFQGSMLFIALIVLLLLQPIVSTASLAVNDIVVVSIMGLICFIPFALFARGVAAKSK